MVVQVSPSHARRVVVKNQRKRNQRAESDIHRAHQVVTAVNQVNRVVANHPAAVIHHHLQVNNCDVFSLCRKNGLLLKFL